MRLQSISFLFLILLIFLRFYSMRPIFKNGDFVRITSKVYNEPLVYDRQQYIKLQGLSFYLPKYPEVSYGDTIIVEGFVNYGKLDNPKLIEIKETKNILYNFRQNL